MRTALDGPLARAKAAAKAANLPEVETGTSYGTPALRAGSFRNGIALPWSMRPGRNVNPALFY